MVTLDSEERRSWIVGGHVSETQGSGTGCRWYGLTAMLLTSSMVSLVIGSQQMVMLTHQRQIPHYCTPVPGDSLPPTILVLSLVGA